MGKAAKSPALEPPTVSRAAVGWGWHSRPKEGGILFCNFQHHSPSTLQKAGCSKHVIAFTCTFSLASAGKTAILRKGRPDLWLIQHKETCLRKMVLKTRCSDIVSYRGEDEWEALWKLKKIIFFSVVFSINTPREKHQILRIGHFPPIDRKSSSPGLVLVFTEGMKF